VQDTVTAELTRDGAGYGNQTVNFTSPDCPSSTIPTSGNGSATVTLTCTEASSIPVTVSVDGRSVVTTVET
jgi:hypothetical protein